MGGPACCNYGSIGTDLFDGGKGDDTIEATDQMGLSPDTPDVVACGPGRTDRVSADPDDVSEGCENVRIVRDR